MKIHATTEYKGETLIGVDVEDVREYKQSHSEVKELCHPCPFRDTKHCTSRTDTPYSCASADVSWVWVPQKTYVVWRLTA